MSPFKACEELRAVSPAEGIFRFFLLFVFSNESYPSTEEAADGGGCGSVLRGWSSLDARRDDRVRISGGDLVTRVLLEMLLSSSP